MMAKITIHTGDFRPGTATMFNGIITFPDKQTLRITALEFVDKASEESVKKVGGTVAWGAAGAALLGPVGLLAGLMLGGKKTEVTFVAQLKDGRKFLGTTDPKTYTALLIGAS